MYSNEIENQIIALLTVLFYIEIRVLSEVEV